MASGRNLEKKGELFMMLEFLETGKALYVLTAVCILGLLSRLTARNLYKRLIRETDNMTLTKNRCLRDLKQKAENTYRLNLGIHNTKAAGWLSFYGIYFKWVGQSGVPADCPLLSFGRKCGLWGLLVSL